jgi:hypothetical protein
MSEVSIINLALARIGSTRRIVDRSEGTPEARAADAIFDHHRDLLLRAHTWTFATRRVQLALSVRTPSHEWEHQHPLPPDFLRAIIVSGDSTGRQNIVYAIGDDENDGQVILSDYEDLWLSYVFRVTDTDRMPPDFQEALALSLATTMASSLAQSNALVDQLGLAYREALVAAKSTDGIETYAEQFPEGSWVTARHGPLAGRW